MAFVRSIGRWAMTGLVINCIIGSGIFGVPGELNRLLGVASPMAMVFAALATAFIIAPTAEVASQFSEPGGAYLYSRRAFGRFAGLQVGWFSLLSVAASDAANASLFVVYLSVFVPGAGHGWLRGLLLAALLAIPALANYRGARNGANLSSVLVVAKLLPLVLLIVLGVARYGQRFQPIHLADIAAPGVRPWLAALLLTGFSYGGFEYALIPGGEFKNPRRTAPFALIASLLTVACVYTLIQFVTLATIGTSTSARPVADTAVVLLGTWGGSMVAIAAMISTSGHISSMMLQAPRLAYSLSAQGEFPAFLSRLHPLFHTPALAIVCYALAVWLLALSGGFLWALMLASGSKMIMYISICAALIQLRRMQRDADALRVPFGPVISVIGIAISLAVIIQITLSGALLMGATAAIATANWWFTKGHSKPSHAAMAEAPAPDTLVP